MKATEGEIGFRLLDSESGGLEGGGSRLTPEARDLCRRFRRVSGGIQEVVSRRFAAEFGDGSEGMQSVSSRDVNGTQLNGSRGRAGDGRHE